MKGCRCVQTRPDQTRTQSMTNRIRPDLIPRGCVAAARLSSSTNASTTWTTAVTCEIQRKIKGFTEFCRAMFNLPSALPRFTADHNSTVKRIECREETWANGRQIRASSNLAAILVVALKKRETNLRYEEYKIVKICIEIKKITIHDNFTIPTPQYTPMPKCENEKMSERNGFWSSYNFQGQTCIYVDVFVCWIQTKHCWFSLNLKHLQKNMTTENNSTLPAL